MKQISNLLFLVFNFCFLVAVQAQFINVAGQQTSIITAVPFLFINPDAATIGQGMANVATEGSVNSYILNPSKMAFQQKGVIASTTYSPWAQALNIPFRFSTTTLAVKINEKNCIAVEYRTFFMKFPRYINYLGPTETTTGLMYAYKLNKYFSLGASLSYLNSNLNDLDFKVSKSVMGGVSASYQNEKKTENADISYRLGAAITNIGAKINYNARLDYFLPTNLGIGAAAQIRFHNAFLVNPSVELNKLLVPSNSGFGVYYLSGALKSGFDAKGGLKEELQEITTSFGTELGKIFSLTESKNSQVKLLLRLGYFNESKFKGNRKLFTTGLGAEATFQKVVFALNGGILLPTTQNSPLQNTFSVGGSFGYLF